MSGVCGADVTYALILMVLNFAWNKLWEKNKRLCVDILMLDMIDTVNNVSLCWVLFLNVEKRHIKLEKKTIC